ncbi:type IX secretion/gliding motility protein PorT/SprT [Brumimicrobium aurantiacum]|uniref:PorT family protein n=1 Tax=Brumimicrobium aurantiacum TaxID=1737063 RepID=A0A3E1EYD3_9FLAO|nr:porin family protein [Brumimicrobium aurantiacum]RFC54559.1 PorT family protein [Brumimicrobium aurantiacum]
MLNKIIISFLLFLIGVEFSSAQRLPLTQNYRKFDRKAIHFGFMLGVNTSDFSTQYHPNMLEKYGMYSITNRSQPGFQLGLISSLKLGTPLIRLRFLPTLSFQERILDYKFYNTDPTSEDEFETYEERIGSTNLDFPLLLKFRTLRYNNFAAYIVAGAQYTIDMQSKEETSQKFSDPFIKLNRDDLQGQIGAGVDFFLPYFKFGMELKMSHGFGNALIQDDTRLSKPIDKLYNRVWWFSLTFEG